MGKKNIINIALLMLIALCTKANANPIECFSASFYETEDNGLLVRIHLSEKIHKRINVRAFKISDGLEVVDQVELSEKEQLLLQKKTGDDDGRNIFLILTGTWQENHTYDISHPGLTDCSLSTSVLPLAYPHLSAKRKSAVPHPYLPNRAPWLDLYYATWGFMEEKITRGKSEQGFVEEYIDEGFNENIYQWDSVFMVAYALHARHAYPAMATLDNFYRKQDPDGYICRTYNENTGKATGSNDINPPLFAWMEARYAKYSGDTSRIEHVLPVLDQYYDWIRLNLASKGTAGAVYNTDFGSGMDNSPRGSFIRQGAWIDLTSQQALAAQSLAYLAEQIGSSKYETKYTQEYRRLSQLINDDMWDEGSGLYLDKDEHGNFHHRHTIASFWPMLAGVPDESRASVLIQRYLKNPDEFYTNHLFPTLSKSDRDYDPNGHYWRGGVWAPTNYATIKGIAKYDPQFAFEAAVNHLENMSLVYHDFRPDNYPQKMPTIHERNIQRNGDGLKQIWETYSPEHQAPATRWDAKLLVRQKFCGWSGLGPVALLIEQILGLEIRGDLGRIRWEPRLLESQGLANISFQDGIIDLRLEKSPGVWELFVESTVSLTLELHMPGQDTRTIGIKPGETRRQL